MSGMPWQLNTCFNLTVVSDVVVLSERVCKGRSRVMYPATLNFHFEVDTKLLFGYHKINRLQ